MSRIGLIKGILNGKYSYGRLEFQNAKGMKIYRSGRKGSIIRTGMDKEQNVISQVTHEIVNSIHTYTAQRTPRVNGKQKYISRNTVQTEPKNNLYKTVINYSGTEDKTSKRQVEMEFQKSWKEINGHFKRNDTLLNAKVITVNGDVFDLHKSFKDVNVSDFVKNNRSNLVLKKNGKEYGIVPYDKTQIRMFFNQFMKGQK